MPRSARIIHPGIPHHVTQRGVRRMQTFFLEEDYHLYKRMLGIFSSRANTKVVAWCLMPNHVHLVLIPEDEDGLRATLAPLHRTYAEEINRRENWTGHLWQSRYASFPLDEVYAVVAARYTELNPVRAGLVQRPEDYAWSSARAHLTGAADGVTNLSASRAITDDWWALLNSGLDEFSLSAIRKHETNCLPLGSETFIGDLEEHYGRALRPKKRGRRWR